MGLGMSRQELVDCSACTPSMRFLRSTADGVPFIVDDYDNEFLGKVRMQVRRGTKMLQHARDSLNRLLRSRKSRSQSRRSAHRKDNSQSHSY